MRDTGRVSNTRLIEIGGSLIRSVQSSVILSAIGNIYLRQGVSGDMSSRDHRSTLQYQTFGLHLTVLGWLVLWLDVITLSPLFGYPLVIVGVVVAVGSLVA